MQWVKDQHIPYQSERNDPSCLIRPTTLYMVRCSVFSLAVGYTLAAWQVTDVALCCTEMKAGYSHQFLYEMQVQINKTVK